MMVGKRGEGLSLNFIIVAILALIVLIVIALFFTGGITKLFGTEKEISSLALNPNIRALAEQSCSLHCTNQNQNAYMNPNFPQDIIDAGFASCAELLNKNFADCSPKKACQKQDSQSAINCASLSQAACESTQGCSWK